MKVRVKYYNDELPKYLNMDTIYELLDTQFIYSNVNGYDILTTHGRIFIKLKGCLHLNGGDWEIVE